MNKHNQNPNNIISLGFLEMDVVSPVKKPIPFSQIFERQELRDQIQQELYDQKPINYRAQLLKESKKVKKKVSLGFQQRAIEPISDDESIEDKQTQATGTTSINRKNKQETFQMVRAKKAKKSRCMNNTPIKDIHVNFLQSTAQQSQRR